MRTATEESVAEAYESHLPAQEKFWDVMTVFLAKHGALMYEQPHFDTLRFTTGPMALEQMELGPSGETLPVPSVTVSSSENSLIFGYFGKRTKNPFTRYFPPPRDKIRDVIRDTYAAEASKNSHYSPYIKITTQFVEHAGANNVGIDDIDGGSGGMYGSRVPKVLLKATNLPILPNTPPPNLKHILGCTTSMMPVGPPEPYAFEIFRHEPEYESEANYARALGEEVEQLIDLRDRHLASMAQITDILNRADQISLPLYDHFERTA